MMYHQPINMCLQQEAQLADAKLVRMVKLNSPEWMFILLGCIGAAVFGCNQPAFSLLFSDIIGVSIQVLFLKIIGFASMV